MTKHSFVLLMALFSVIQFCNPVRLSAQNTDAESLARLKHFIGKYQFTNNTTAFQAI